MERARSALRCIPLVLLAGLSGCAFAAHRSSPWEYGGALRVAPGFYFGEAGLSAHPMVSYTYLTFDGGHDAILEGGGQVRMPLAGGGGRARWVGAEAAVSRLTTEIDDFESTSTNGFSLTAMIGQPFDSGRWGTSVYAGGGISRYGSTGINLRLGIDLQPWFMNP